MTKRSKPPPAAIVRHTESEAHSRAIFDSINDAIVVHDLETGAVLDVNQRLCDLFGFTREEVLRLGVGALSSGVPPYNAEGAMALNRKAAEGEPQVAEWQARDKSGRLFWIEVSLKRANIEGEERLLAVARDITERKRMEDELRESQRRLSTLMSNIPGMVYQCRNDENWTMLFVSEGCLELTGYSPEALVGNAEIAYADLVHPDDREMVWREVQAGVRERRPYQFTYRITTATGAEKWVWEQGRGVFGDSGELLTLEGLVTDITERKRTEQKLLNEMKLSETIINSLPGPFYMINQSHVMVRWNQYVDEYIDFPRELRGVSPVGGAIVEEDRALGLAKIQEAFDKGSAIAELRVRHRDGSIHDYFGTAVRIDLGDESFLVGVAIDITERKRTEKALAESERKYRGIFENAPICIFQSTVEGRLLNANPAGFRLFGYEMDEELLRTDAKIGPTLFAHPEQRDEIIHAVRESDGFVRFENEYRRRDGSTFLANLFMRAVREGDRVLFLEGFVEDITERKRAEEEKRAFYRETILSATGGKLVICDEPDIEPYLLGATMRIQVSESLDLGLARRAVALFCGQHGLTQERLDDLVLGVGEAVTNSLKHAGGGSVSAGAGSDSVWVAVSDKGPGIESLILPRAILRRGFSTKPSLGLGYSIILEVADQVLLKTGQGGTDVVMVKYLHAQEELTLDTLPDTWDAVAGLQ